MSPAIHALITKGQHIPIPLTFRMLGLSHISLMHYVILRDSLNLDSRHRPDFTVLYNNLSKIFSAHFAVNKRTVSFVRMFWIAAGSRWSACS